MSNDLLKFLEARLDEDYDIAFGGASSPWDIGEWKPITQGYYATIEDRFGEPTAVSYYGGTTGHIVHFDPTRVIADIEAKRKIIQEYEDVARSLQSGDRDRASFEFVAYMRLSLMFVLRALAEVYRNHEDYREEWAA